MPCYEPPWGREFDTQKEQLLFEDNARLISLLCSVSSILERLNYNFKENPALDEWWNKHKFKESK